MPIPLKAIIYDPGAGGAPTTSNPRDLSGWAQTYEDSLANELGCESCRIVGMCASIEEAVDWTERLMSSLEVYTPAGRPRFFGMLHAVSIPALEIALSLTDMANAVIVRYTDPDGKKGSQTATNSASIAKYGRKELVLNFSTAYSAEATNRAATVLAQLAQPLNKETVSNEASTGGYKVELTFRGWAEALKWLTTTSTTTATAVTSTQVSSLISAYNATNAFFDTAGASITSTGFSATQYCDADTTYFERVATLLAAGNSSQQRVAWGFYTRAITIGAAASATPDTIAYYYSKRKGELRDPYNNIVPVWDWVPDVMIQNTDAIHPPAPSGAITNLTRKYIRRVSCSINERGEVRGNLEPDDPDKLPEFLAKPVSVTSGVSTRHAQIDSRIVKAAQIRTIDAGNPTIYNPSTGVLNPAAGGTGVSNSGTIDLGGGSISTGGGSISTGGGSISTGGGSIGNTGGGAVDLGTGTGIGGAGSSGVTSSGGTTGRVAQWSSSTALTAATLIKSGAGVLTLSATGTATLTIDSTTRLDGSGASSGDVLTWNGTAYAPATPGSGAPSNATYIVQTANASLSNEQALGALATGILKNTTTTGVLSIAVAGTDYAAASHTHTASDITNFNESVDDRVAALLVEGTNVTLTYSDAGNTLTIDVPNFAPTNATYIVQTASGSLSNEQALGALSTGILKNTTTTGVLSIATGSDLPSHTHAASDITSGTMATARLGSGTANSSSYLRGDQTWATISAVTGSGTSGRLAVWNGTSSLTSDTGILYDTTSNDLSVAGGLDLGGATALGTGSIAGSGNFRFNGSGTVDTGLNVGSASGAPTGVIRTSGDVNVGGGLYVGSSSASVVDGDIVCSGKYESGAGANYDIGGITFSVLSIVGYIAITHNGIARKLAVVN